MFHPIQLAIEVHKLCEEELIPKGISPKHDIMMHSYTTTYYTNALNDAGFDVTPQQAAAAILEAAEWDRDSPWPGHPSPDKVIEILTNRSST